MRSLTAMKPNVWWRALAMEHEVKRFVWLKQKNITHAAYALAMENK